MGDPTTCRHDSLYWYASPANERGWKCVDCGHQPGEEPGYSPQHDRELLHTKVGCILMDLHEAKIICVSNGTGGDALTAHAAKLCRERNLYDSVSIARVILELVATERHAKFWRDISEGILAGKDPRERCACGKLASQSCGDHWACCHEHMRIALGRDPGEPF